MIYLYLFGTCFHFIYVFMIIRNKIKWHLKHYSNGVTPYHHSKVPFFSLLTITRVSGSKRSVIFENSSRYEEKKIPEGWSFFVQKILFFVQKNKKSPDVFYYIPRDSFYPNTAFCRYKRNESSINIPDSDKYRLIK